MGRYIISTIINMTDAAPKAKNAAKAKAPAAHPPYATMIAAAIKGLGDKKGSSRQAILKYIVANYKVIAAKKVVAAAAAGKKGAGSFKLPAKEPKAKKAKKPKAKKPKKVKKAKKPAAKKPKKAAKKPAAKKAAKKPAANKAAKKPAAKKATKKK